MLETFAWLSGKGDMPILKKLPSLEGEPTSMQGMFAQCRTLKTTHDLADIRGAMHCYVCHEDVELIGLPQVTCSGYSREPQYYCPKCFHMYTLHFDILSLILGTKYTPPPLTDYEQALKELNTIAPGVPNSPNSPNKYIPYRDSKYFQNTLLGISFFLSLLINMLIWSL